MTQSVSDKIYEDRSVPRTGHRLEAMTWDDLAPAHESKLQGVRHEQGFLDAFDGTKIFWQAWSSSGDADRRGRIALIHGYGEHSTRYEHVAQALVRSGYDVMAMDVRGHGQSEGVDAYVASYDHYIEDLELLVEHLCIRWGENRGPLYVLGHSNGGLITLQYALRRPRKVSGFVITSPFCGVAVKIPFWKDRLGRIMSKVWPTFALPSELDPMNMSHDMHVVNVYKKDLLNRRVVTARWFTEMEWAQADLLERAPLIKQPVLMLLGGADRSADPEVAQKVFHRLGSPERELEVYRGMYHEILNELEWQHVMRRIVGWLDQQSADYFRLHELSDEEE